MRNIGFSSLRQFGYHFFSILLIFLVLVLIRYPFFLNSDHFFTSDEGMLASTILDLLNGGPIVFYYDFGRTFGLTFGLASAPFIWIFGATSTAFNLPATLFYSLYTWTTYLLSKTLAPRTAYLILTLMLFTPYFITELTTHNWPHVPAAFLGNLIFLLFMKVKLSERNNGPMVFFLFFTMGVAIYTYTFSTIYILTIVILYALTHPQWDQLRGKISVEALIGRFKNKKTKKEIICRLLDVLIFMFSVAVIFSYVFGGFGLDIGGISILQINHFNKAAMQLLAIIFLRILIDHQGAKSWLGNAKSYFATRIQKDKKCLAFVGGAGFFLGLSPRIASILMGETSRGGQGHDLDFLPTKLLVHFWDLITVEGPLVFGFYETFRDLISNPIDTYWIILSVLLMSLIAIFFSSAFSFISDNWGDLKSIVTLKSIQFKAVSIILLVPILICIANIITQNGPLARYLIPLFGISTLWVGIYVDKIQKKVKWFPILVMVIWMSFYSITNYQVYQDTGHMEGIKPVKFNRHYIHDVVDFLESKGISVAYSGYHMSGPVTFASAGKINVSEYYVKPVSKARKARSMSNPHFALIVPSGDKPPATIYRNYLQEKGIEFKIATVAKFEILWDFVGEDAEINNLRSLYPYRP